jgi:LPPG:FO 2-phospho-L-lactate transferase
VSLGPILRLPGVRERVARRPAAAVSPIVGGQAIKGPAAKMLRELGLEVSALPVAQAYAGLARLFVLDHLDAGLQAGVEALGLQVLVTDTVMRNEADRARLAREVLAAVAPPVAA